MRAVLAVTVLAWTAVLAGCATRPAARETLLGGETMGSAWTVKVVGELPMPAEDLRAGIQSRFDAVNLALSTWRKDSALSRFNSSDTAEWQVIDAELATVMEYALSLAEASNGAYDITVGPLVNLWGFGPDPAMHRVPDAQAIERAQALVGWRQVAVDVARHRARKPPGVYVDLSSLGKGRGVDRVAEYLDAQGVTNYLIDLSGKLRAHGSNSQGVAWRVAVERPSADAGTGEADMDPVVVTLRDSSVATAGDYRRYFETGGRHYSHIIDPRTGSPVAHHTVSATALAAGCMQADALATVLMVMPPGEALAMAAQRRVAALLIAREATGFKVQASQAWIEAM